ncbi:hypothetical protein CPB86DRAFT_177757 [Serendipita vermifera]|nr:hypothetical protein CPB86DRAFT_177757 [Serendipita vermifera]
MNKVILLTMILAMSQLSWAIPVPMKVDLQYGAEDLYPEDNKAVGVAVTEANNLLQESSFVFQTAMKDAKEGKDSRAVQIVEASFGPNWQQHQHRLQEDLNKLSNRKVTVFHPNAAKSERMFQKAFPGANMGIATTAVPLEKGKPLVYLHSKWHKLPSQDQGAALIHEGSHALFGTVDDVAGTGPDTEFIGQKEAQEKGKSWDPNKASACAYLRHCQIW